MTRDRTRLIDLRGVIQPQSRSLLIQICPLTRCMGRKNFTLGNLPLLHTIPCPAGTVPSFVPYNPLLSGTSSGALRSAPPRIRIGCLELSEWPWAGRQVAALRGEQETLGSHRDELAEFLEMDSNEVQVWQELVISPSCSTVLRTTNYPRHSHLSSTNLWIWT